MHNKWQRGCTWGFTWFKYEHVSAVENAPEDTPIFEVETKGALQVAIELHLKMHMGMHLLA